jgi:hypothetical protein
LYRYEIVKSFVKQDSIDAKALRVLYFLQDTTYAVFFFNLVFEAIGTAAIPGLLCQPRVITKMIVEK